MRALRSLARNGTSVCERLELGEHLFQHRLKVCRSRVETCDLRLQRGDLGFGAIAARW
jgi:hypothetical protein